MTGFDVYDPLSVKKELDDAVIQIMLSDAFAFKESLAWHNRRLLVMTAATVAGFSAQFAPMSLSYSRWLVGALVLLFFALYGVLQYLTYFVDKEYIFILKANKALGFPMIKIRSSLPRYSDMYSIGIDDANDQLLAETKLCVGNYFTKTGEFASRYFKDDLQALLDQAKDKVAANAKGETKKSK